MRTTADLAVNQDASFSNIDVHFARFICRLANKDEPGLFLGAALASNAVRSGHVCADLSLAAGAASFSLSASPPSFSAPALPQWLDLLKTSSVVGSPGVYRPLILDGSRLYLYRYWRYEQQLAAAIRGRSLPLKAPDHAAGLAEALDKLFPCREGGGPDYGKLAALVAATKNLAIISGGPGTGKTTLAIKILALLLEQANGTALRIALAAPTGKAAARLKEAIAEAFASGLVDSSLLPLFPRDAFTIHRLLGAIPGSAGFRHNAENPLPLDVVVIDEASMVDLALMAKLVAAIPEGAKLIFLGDKDQLASVEAGAVLGDICDSGAVHAVTPSFSKMVSTVLPGLSLAAGEGEPPLADCIVELRKNYRFDEGSGLGVVSGMVRQGDGPGAWDSLEKGHFRDISQKSPAATGLTDALSEVVATHYIAYLRENDPFSALARFNEFRILCAVRKGPYGVEAINAAVEKILASGGMIRPSSPWYHGRPIMILSNDYGLDLFNGDVGLVLSDGSCGGQLRAFFPAEQPGTMRSLLPQRLPPHETVYAMTVHKAQGSQFEEALVTLPAADSPVLSRELVYTAITRARKSCALWASKEVFIKAVENRVRRMSGLREELWNR